jgi:quercetin dioxygenase-like cupin family protein
MRRLLTGVNEDGRSCVVEETEIAPTEAVPGIAAAMLFATSQSPPPPRPAGRGDFLDLGVAPGVCRWMMLDWDPHHSWAMHHTDTLDFDLVLSGRVDLILEAGEFNLEPGDCAVITGVDHAWRAGPSGCRISIITLGTPPPSS